MSSQTAHQPLFVLRRHNSAVITCALDGQGLYSNLLLSGDVDGIVTLWDLELRAALLSFHAVKTALAEAQPQSRETPPLGFSNNGVLKVGFLAFEALGNFTGGDVMDVGFYTQCRNQRLYVWHATLGLDNLDKDDTECGVDEKDKMSPRLLHIIDVPQHGFCTVPCVLLSSREVQLAVPHDGDGVISLWNVGIFSKEESIGQDVRAHCLISFSAAGSLRKCGTIMCINYRDTDHFSVAFESGHVTLNSTRGERLAIVRAFAETALTCLWSDNTLLASSVEGQLHCYSVVGFTTLTGGESANEESGTVSLVVRWELSLRKSIGSVALQRHLAVVGSWDHTLRLYDEGSGRVVSILTFHGGVVNEVSIAPPSAVWCTSFGFDMRQPRWGGAGHFHNCLKKKNTSNTNECKGGHENGDHEEDVYLFASASGDFTIAVWRVDFKVLRAFALKAA